MPKWWIKATVQRAIGFLPYSNLWNELFQSTVTASTRLSDARFESQLKRCREHLEVFRLFGPSPPGDRFTAFELGTGRYPIVPVGLYLCGADDIRTWDIAPLLRQHRVLHMLRRFIDYYDRGALRNLLPEARSDRIGRLRQAVEQSRRDPPGRLLERFGIRPAVGDARRSGLPAGTVDLVTSTVVLEYIPANVLTGLLAEFHRIASPRGVMSHVIDLADEYSYFDPSLSPFNFLRYSRRMWGLINNPLIPLNRLRLPDYRGLIAGAGFDVVIEECTRGEPRDLKRVPLAPKFRDFSEDDLLVLIARIVARPSPLTRRGER